MAKENKGKKITEEASIDSQERLIRIMNDSPTLMKLSNTEWEIRGLKPAVQWMIAEEACNILKGENLSYGDVLKQFATNLPSVVRVLTLALLNDKERIEKEYKEVYDTLMWGDIKIKDWGKILFEVLSLVDIEFFFVTTNAIQTIRETTTQRKMTIAEVKQLSREQNGGK